MVSDLIDELSRLHDLYLNSFVLKVKDGLFDLMCLLLKQIEEELKNEKDY